MKTDKVRKRSIVYVENGDHDKKRSETRSVTDTLGRAGLIVQKLLQDMDLKPGDSIILDVGIVVKHADKV